MTLNGLYEGEAGTESAFELVHRRVRDPAAPRAWAGLTFPREFVVVEKATHAGRVASAPEYAFEDTTYRLTLKDRSLGLHRADVLLRGKDGHELADVPIVWLRQPYLSSVPERLSLSSRPARAFLRCQDERVELLRVRSAPKWARAVVSSPRELLVSLRDDAPRVAEGFVEVETTARGGAPMRLQVVRYAAPSQPWQIQRDSDGPSTAVSPRQRSGATR